MTEYIDWLRARVGSSRVLIPATAAIIVDRSGSVLLQLRSDTENWGCPGGLMDIGETVLQSLAREVLEETGLIVESASLFGVYSGPDFEVIYPDGNKTAPVMLVFVVDGWVGVPRIDAESTELSWFPPDALPENMNRFHGAGLSDYRRSLGGEIETPVLR